MIHVLIVDDHQLLRRGLKEVLAEEFSELEVGEADSSQTALEMLLTKQWDLVLLDIAIPGRSGLEVLQEAKRLQPQAAVLVLSGYAEEQFAVRALKLGAAGYLNKNRASDELIDGVRKALAGGKYVSAALAEKLAGRLTGNGQPELHEGLSTRELQVLRAVASGRTIKEIAAELALSEKTVGTYRRRISQKLGLATNVELTRYSLQHRLVD
jgi:two-component system invasion response regulator UvrY